MGQGEQFQGKQSQANVNGQQEKHKQQTKENNLQEEFGQEEQRGQQIKENSRQEEFGQEEQRGQQTKENSRQEEFGQEEQRGQQTKENSRQEEFRQEMQRELQEEQKEEQRKQHQQQKEYQQYIKEVTPTHNLWMQMAKAFLVGGVICCIGQGILNYAGSLGLDKQTSGSWCSLILVLLSVILTGFGIYPKIVKWGGAGALVPITGFANSVAAPAIEYKAEGQVFGIGCKIFTIAGPVILYGIFSSWLLGVGYWIGKCFGVF